NAASAAKLRLEALRRSRRMPVFPSRPKTAASAPSAIAATFGSWIERGPVPIFGEGNHFSGQATQIALDLAHDPGGTIAYYGTSNGGLWKSTNALRFDAEFRPLSDQSLSLSVGSIALDTRDNPRVPGAPAMVYVGTGDAKSTGLFGSFTGVGILRS